MLSHYKDSFIFTNKKQRINCCKQANGKYSFKSPANEIALKMKTKTIPSITGIDKSY